MSEIRHLGYITTTCQLLTNASTMARECHTRC